jgi:uncharacterized membrane protein YfcA
MVDHLFWLVLAALIIGISKGGISSAATLAVPMLALFMSPVQAAALMLPILIVTDVVAVWLYRRDFSGRNVAILLPAILFGIVVATVILPYASQPVLLAFTGFVGLWAVWRSWFGRTPEASPAHVMPGLFWGTIAGITTFITHSGAPPIQAFLFPQKLPRLVFAGTMAICFAVGNLAKLPSYSALGLFEGIDWRLLAMLAAVGIFGTFIGRWLVKQLTDFAFARVIEILLLLLSVTLLAKATMSVF